MHRFIGIVLYMSVVDLTFRRMYWSANTCHADVAYFMTRNRLDEILSLLHASNDDDKVKKGEDGHDSLQKVRHVLIRLNINFWEAAGIETYMCRCRRHDDTFQGAPLAQGIR